MYAGLNNGRVQVFDRKQLNPGETTLTSSFETLSLASSSPILTLQYIQKNSFFQSSGLLVGSNDKSAFYEYIPNCEYRYHALPIDSKTFAFLKFVFFIFLLKSGNLSSLYYDSQTNRLLASYRPASSSHSTNRRFRTIVYCFITINSNICWFKYQYCSITIENYSQEFRNIHRRIG